MPLFVADSPKFIDAAECRLVKRGDQLRAHTPNINLRPLQLETGNQSFVEIIAGNNACFRKPSFIEDFSRFNTQPILIS